VARGTNDHETRLLIEELCPECKGVGCYYAPAWAEYNKAWDEAKAQAEREVPTGSHTLLVCVNNRTEELLKTRGVTAPDGPEEPDCPTCEGSGRATRYVTLLELADLIDAARAARKK